MFSAAKQITVSNSLLNEVATSGVFPDPALFVYSVLESSWSRVSWGPGSGLLSVLDDRCLVHPGIILEHVHHGVRAVCKADLRQAVEGIKPKPILGALWPLAHL